MKEQERRSEIEKAKEVLSKMDPELAMMAIRQAEVDFEEVNKIKDFLSKSNPEAVQYAIAELQQESMSKEFSKVKEQLETFELMALKEAAVELGFAARVGYCIDAITCRGNCIQIMAVRCEQPMIVYADRRDWVVNPEVMESVFGRAVARALAQAK
jgi:hypothetical protein